MGAFFVFAPKVNALIFRALGEFSPVELKRSQAVWVRCNSKMVKINEQTGEVIGTVIHILPTHYKCRQSGALLEVENPKTWVYHDEEDTHE